MYQIFFFSSTAKSPATEPLKIGGSEKIDPDSSEGVRMESSPPAKSLYIKSEP